MKNSIKIFFGLLLFSNSVFSQKTDKITISGYITEQGSKETLIGANLYFPSLKIGTSTNAFGFYTITIPKSADSLDLMVSFIGYRPTLKKILPSTNISMNFPLESSTNLREVTITGNKVNIARETQMSTINIPIAQIRNVPALLGEKDLIKMIQLLPGVQKGSEGQAGLYVRGGGPDQNLIILDDAPVYNANHLFGFFSTFNGDAIKNAELIKGGFPARYGGRLSSVLDISMKDGDKEKLNAEGGVGIISSRLTLDGPIKKGKSSFLISGRRTYIDILAFPIIKLIQSSQGFDRFSAGYFFYDLNAKLNFELDEKNRLFFSGYFGKDKFYSRLAVDSFKAYANLNWGNATGTARWNHQYSPKMFGNLSLIISDYTFDVGQSFENGSNVFNLKYISGINDYMVKQDFDFRPNSRNLIRFGALVTYHRFTPEALTVKGNLAPNSNRKNIINTIESGIYVEDDFKVNDLLNVSGGLRLSIFNTGKLSRIRPEPRLSARYLLSPDHSLKASYAEMNQYLHLLSNSVPGLPTDLWVPATEKIKPQFSRQYAVGLARTMLDKGIEITLEGYYKQMENVIAYKDGANFIDPEEASNPNNSEFNSFENKVVSGNGLSFGAEFFVKYEKNNFFGWIGYTLSKTTLQFDSLNAGKSFPAKYDRRHDISIVGTYKINNSTRVSLTWVFGTGNALTMPISTLETSNYPYRNNNYGSNKAELYGDRNGYRVPSYHRLDIALQKYKKKKRGERTWEYGLYNAYNRANPFFVTTYSKFDNATMTFKNVLAQVALFPLIPSISYSFKFN